MLFWPVLAAIVAIALVYVIAPVGLTVFAHFRHPKRVRCPQSGETATVTLDPGRAALAAVVGGQRLHLCSCSLLAGRFGCGEWCTRLDHGAFQDLSESSR